MFKKLESVLDNANKRIFEHHIEDSGVVSESLKEKQAFIHKLLSDDDDDDTFVVADTDTKTISLKKLKKTGDNKWDIDGLPANQNALMKLTPLKVPSNGIDRAKKKGIQDVSPGLSKFIDRTNNSKDDGKLFRVMSKTPGIALGRKKGDTSGELHRYNLNNKDLVLDKIYNLPRIRKITSDIDGEAIPVFLPFDFINNSKLSGKTPHLVRAALVGKNDTYKFTGSDRDKLWKVGVSIISGVLHTYNESVDNVIVPTSSGALVAEIRKIFKEYYPSVNIITIKKPEKTKLLKFYDKNRNKYDKMFIDKVVPSYKDKDTYDKYKPKDLFTNQDGNPYPEMWYNGDNNYEERDDSVIKIAKLKTAAHRQLMATLMSDFIISDNSIGSLSGNSIIIDDSVTSGSTIVSFLYPVVKKLTHKNVYAFALFSNSGTINQKQIGR